jgi:hypothetical protein
MMKLGEMFVHRRVAAAFALPTYSDNRRVEEF